MDYEGIVRSVQEHMTDGLALVIGSGLSAAEGISGMPALAAHLDAASTALTGDDLKLWSSVKTSLDAKEGLEAALLKNPPSDTLEEWIVHETCELMLPEERAIMSLVLRGDRRLRLTKLLLKVLKPTGGLPILTPNYDRLIEVACEMAGYHVDTTAVGQYAGEFDHLRSCMSSARGISSRNRFTAIDHFPRAIVLKPHGSFDWYRSASGARRCSRDLDADRLIVTPGVNKYRAGYNAPFDKHRELANDHIRRANRLLVIGYGFNDDHLETHLVQQIKDGTPTFILNRSISAKVQALAAQSPSCSALSKPSGFDGVAVTTKSHSFEHAGDNIWDLGVLAEVVLA
jgi:hypothetical protein